MKINKQITIVRHENNVSGGLGFWYCETKEEVRKAVLECLECQEDGDSITFEVIYQ